MGVRPWGGLVEVDREEPRAQKGLWARNFACQPQPLTPDDSRRFAALQDQNLQEQILVLSGPAPQNSGNGREASRGDAFPEFWGADCVGAARAAHFLAADIRSAAGKACGLAGWGHRAA